MTRNAEEAMNAYSVHGCIGTGVRLDSCFRLRVSITSHFCRNARAHPIFAVPLPTFFRPLQTYGRVYDCTRRSDDLRCVLKQVPLGGLSQNDRAETLNEASILRRAQSPHVVTYVDSWEDPESDCLYIVMEHAGEDLSVVMRESGGTLSEDDVWRCLLPVVQGLAHLHSVRVLHRDLKPANVFCSAREEGDEASSTGGLIAGGSRVVIGDLGLGRVLGAHSDFAKTGVGTPLYFSPELCKEEPYDHKSDVWALGCLAHELLTGCPPFTAENQIALASKIVSAPLPPLPEETSPDLAFVISMALTKDPAQRPSAADLLGLSCVRTRLEREALRSIVAEEERVMRRAFAAKERALRAELHDERTRVKARASEVEALHAATTLAAQPKEIAALVTRMAELESANAALVARLEVTEVRLSDTERQRAALAAKLEVAVSAAAAERAERGTPLKSHARRMPPVTSPENSPLVSTVQCERPRGIIPLVHITSPMTMVSGFDEMRSRNDALGVRILCGDNPRAVTESESENERENVPPPNGRSSNGACTRLSVSPRRSLLQGVAVPARLAPPTHDEELAASFTSTREKQSAVETSIESRNTWRAQTACEPSSPSGCPDMGNDDNDGDRSSTSPNLIAKVDVSTSDDGTADFREDATIAQSKGDIRLGVGAHSIKLVARTLTYDTEVRDDANTTMSLQTRELVCPSLHEGTGTASSYVGDSFASTVSSPLPLPPAPIASYVHSVFRPITPAAAAATNNLSRPNAKPVSDTGIMMPRDAVMRSRPAVRVAAGGAVSLDAAALGLAALKTSFSDGMFAVLYTWRRARKKVDPPIGRRLTNAVTLTTPRDAGEPLVAPPVGATSRVWENRRILSIRATEASAFAVLYRPASASITPMTLKRAKVRGRRARGDDFLTCVVVQLGSMAMEKSDPGAPWRLAEMVPPAGRMGEAGAWVEIMLEFDAIADVDEVVVLKADPRLAALAASVQGTAAVMKMSSPHPQPLRERRWPGLGGGPVRVPTSKGEMKAESRAHRADDTATPPRGGIFAEGRSPDGPLNAGVSFTPPVGRRDDSLSMNNTWETAAEDNGSDQTPRPRCPGNRAPSPARGSAWPLKADQVATLLRRAESLREPLPSRDVTVLSGECATESESCRIGYRSKKERFRPEDRALVRDLLQQAQLLQDAVSAAAARLSPGPGLPKASDCWLRGERDDSRGGRAALRELEDGAEELVPEHSRSPESPRATVAAPVVIAAWKPGSVVPVPRKWFAPRAADTDSDQGGASPVFDKSASMRWRRLDGTLEPRVLF